MGKHIRAHAVGWQRVFASPAVRVTETIEIAGEAAGETPPVIWDRRIYLASSAALIDLLREQDEATGGTGARSILLVGHNPGLEDLIFDLVPDDGSSPLRDVVEDKFPTATYAVVQLAIDNWRDLREGCGALIHLIRPRDLDPSLGPTLED